jgi:hypothetical protein
MSALVLADITVPQTIDQLPDVKKGIFVILLHASRVPPHIGLIINGNYHSLTLKGTEPDVDAAILLRSIQQNKTESIFFEIKEHPVFSNDYLKDVFKEILKKYPKIVAGEVTCLSPVSDFFEEFYAVLKEKDDIIYKLIHKLNENGFISKAFLVNLWYENGLVKIPIYNTAQLEQTIKAITH